jgi:signal transduction histidine kinase
MKMRNKITVIFVLLTASMLMCIFTVVYIFSFRYSESEFFERLAERSLIVGQSYFEEDELSASVYAEIRDKYLRRLPGERESIFEIDTARKVIIDGAPTEGFPPRFFETIFAHRYAQGKSENLYHAGILYLDNQGNFIVVVSAGNPYGQAKMENLRDTLIVSYLIGLLLLFVLGRYYAGKVLDPIAAITAKAKDISASNLHVRLTVENESDELGELARTMNDMLDRLEQDFENQTNFVSNASHELKNPLTAILGEIEIVLQNERSAEEYKTSLSTVGKEAQRIDDLVSSLLQLAMADTERMQTDHEAVPLIELFEHIQDDARRVHPDTPLHIDSPAGALGDIFIPGNRQLLRAALWNVVDNACKFSGENDVHISIEATDVSITIAVIDQGMGIPHSDIPHVQETLYRAPNARGFQGFGIGLALTKRIVELHSGSIRITSDIDHGTRVELGFPGR